MFKNLKICVVFMYKSLRLVKSWHCLFVGTYQEDNADGWGGGESSTGSPHHNLYPFQL